MTMTTNKLTLVTTTVNGITTRSVEHPEHGPLIMAADLVEGLGYHALARDVLMKARVPPTDRIRITGSSIAVSSSGMAAKFGTALFITRKGVNLVLMKSGKPIAQEIRQWLAGDVMPAIADTGGYLLNEAARDTARADTRQTMPLPEHLGGAYEALIAEKRKNIACYQ